MAGDFSLKAPFINLSAHVFLLGKKTQKYQLCIVVGKEIIRSDCIWERYLHTSGEYIQSEFASIVLLF